MLKIIKANAKALILLVLIALAAISQSLGLDLGLDIQHYVALLIADGIVWAVPNTKDEPEPTEPTPDA